MNRLSTLVLAFATSVSAVFVPTLPLLATAPVDSLPPYQKLWDFSDPAGTEARFRELLPRAETSGRTAYLVSLLSQIARSEGLQGKSDAAHATLDRAEALLTTTTDGDEMNRARLLYLLERGRAHNGIPGATDAEAGARKAKARPLFLRAWELARATGQDALALDAAHMLGIVDPPESALQWSLKAIALAEQTSDPRARGWLGPLTNNIGWTYHDAGDYAKALEFFQRGVEFRAQHPEGARELRIAKWAVARALRSLGRVEEALAAQRALGEEWRQAGEEGPYVIEELAECLHALGRDEEARPHFCRAHDLLSHDQWLIANEPERLARLKELGQAPD